MFVSMPHHIRKCTITLHDYAIINYLLILMSVSCVNLKKIGKVFTNKFVGTGPSSYEKRIYRAAVSQKVEKHCFALCNSPEYCLKLVQQNDINLKVKRNFFSYMVRFKYFRTIVTRI